MAEVELKPLPFDEAVAYWRRRSRNLLPSYAWQDVWQAEHTRAFTVAKGMQLDVLADIRDALDEAIAGGGTLEQFRRDLVPKLQAKGWWGKAQQVDPLTGQTELVQLGSPRRLTIIYDVNMRTSYAAGRWEQIQRVKAARPYLRYVAVLDERTREDHRRWHGTVLPVDHAWWHEHYPPNGWRCRCRVVQLSERDLQRFGYKLTDPAPASPTRSWSNRRTGETITVPEGIDPGFGYNVGRAHMEGVADSLAGKVASADPEIASVAIRDLTASPAFADWLQRPQGHWPVLQLRGVVADAIGAKRRVASLSAETIAKQRRHHPELSVEDYRALPGMGEAPDLVVQDGDQTVVIVKRAGKLYWAAVKTTKTGFGTFVASFRLTSPKDVERLLRRGRIVDGEWK
jgi:SPP1 gp7 family putative phage head morphogenesis protein